MTWNIAQAKQRFSEVVHASAREPQQIRNRNKVVALVVGGADMAAFEAWRRQAARRSLADEFIEARLLLAEEDGAPPMPPRVDRPNAFAQMLAEAAHDVAA
ncbi:MAG: prevent-host-death protein [Methylococcaceae bacterium]|nr:MAG: prevent-host-death protein [Methylococcaceae bacterium]